MRVHPLAPAAPGDPGLLGAPSAEVALAHRRDLRVQPAARPGWVHGGGRTPAVGEPVYCLGGEGVVSSLHGKTGDGTRLLQIRLTDPKAAPFFAAASNVLIAP